MFKAIAYESGLKTMPYFTCPNSAQRVLYRVSYSGLNQVFNIPAFDFLNCHEEYES